MMTPHNGLYNALNWGNADGGSRRRAAAYAGETWMPNDVMVRLDTKIDALTMDIDRVAKNAQGEIARLKEAKQALVTAKASLTPANEALVRVLKEQGVL